MQVVIIAPPWLPVPPPAYGGAEAVIDVLAQGLRSAGHDVVLVATGDSTCPVPTSSVLESGLGVGASGSWEEMRHVRHGYEVAARTHADIVHDHTLLGPLHGVHRDGLAVVTTNHGPFAGSIAQAYRALRGRVPIIAISHDQAASAGDIPVQGVVHHGIVADDFPMGEGGGGFALFLGRMHPDKGVEAACRIARRAGLPLKIAAKMREPIERTFFEARVRPLLGGDIEYLGEVGLDAKREVLGSAVCLLNPIAWPEPFGMVMIEAMACGTPVLARPLGAAPEIVRHRVTGLLAGSDAELAALTDVAVSLDRRECRRDVERRFSAERMVRQHIELYQAVIEARGSRGRRAGPAPYDLSA
jgi:glycosyltransferase involved in cell wall biosynthesis